MIRRHTACRCCIMTAWFALAGHGSVAAQGLPGTTPYAAGPDVWIRFLHDGKGYAGGPDFAPFAASPDYRSVFRRGWNAGRDPNAAAAVRTFRIAYLFKPPEELLFDRFTHSPGRLPVNPGHRTDDGPARARPLGGTGHGWASADRHEEPARGGDLRPAGIAPEIGGAGMIVAEPATLLLLASGLAGVGCVAAVRRRRRGGV